MDAGRDLAETGRDELEVMELWKDIRECWREILMWLLICLSLVGLACFGESYKCSSRWAQSGMATLWGPAQGCLIQHNGKWIPESSYREMP